MVIWILNPYDAVPGEAGYPQRFATLARVLAGRGHEVVWWSSAFSHAEKRMRAVVADDLGYRLQLVSTPPYQRNVSLARILSHRSWARNLRREAEELVARGELAKPDLVLASMPPMETVKLLHVFRRRWEAVTVLDIMDRWPDTFCLVLPRVLHPMLALARAGLKRGLRQLDGISAQSEAFLQYGRDLGASCPGHVCYLGANRVEVSGERTSISQGLRLVYLGTMGRVYDLDTLVTAVLQLRNEGMAVSLDMVGDGDRRPELEKLARGAGTAITFHGRLEGVSLRRVLEKAHLGVVPMFPVSGVAVPYKAGDYLAHGLGVVSSLPGELDALLGQYHCGNRYEAGNVDSLKGAVRYWLQTDRWWKAHAGAQTLFRAKFDRTGIYPAFAEWLEGVGK